MTAGKTGMGIRASFLMLLLGFFIGSGYAQACCAVDLPYSLTPEGQVSTPYSSSAPHGALLVKACCHVPSHSLPLQTPVARAPLPEGLDATALYLSIHLSLPDPPPKNALV
jgi:hypothetical protein